MVYHVFNALRSRHFASEDLFERRRHRNFETRLIASLDGLIAGVELSFKEHDWLILARQIFERRLTGRRASSKLPGLLVLINAHWY
ncbi:DUF1612 domain-containing protein [Ochrobactrum oryzae]|uniref:DUF1612 domain-containing protein n=1 Tax=Brucella oryzae TaxID=335286 RepID=UPI0011B08288|nr:DUF1612 domain-containing protein [Brucella oryzae]